MTENETKTTMKEEKLNILTWYFSDRASCIDYILITNLDALIIIYS